ncbi:MAG: hypothetical protein V1737_03750 [Chloroflexota bacterium]
MEEQRGIRISLKEESWRLIMVQLNQAAWSESPAAEKARALSAYIDRKLNQELNRRGEVKH